MTKLHYESIETNEVSTGRVPFEHQQPEVDMRISIRRNVMLVIGMVVTIGLVAVSITSGATSDGTAAILFMGNNNGEKIRDCTFHECITSTCQFLTASYTCLEYQGNVNGGCSVIPWYVPGDCDEQCNLANCDSLPVPKDEHGCEYSECDDDACAKKCPDNTPYQCTEGSSTYGCTNDKFMWTYKSAHSVCSKCCDVTTC
jgi:hypothetical protein